MGEQNVETVGAAVVPVRGKEVRRVLAVVVAVAALVAVAMAGTSSAGAAVIPGAITSVSTTATSVVEGDRVDFQCTWAVPDGSQPGDTFTLQLPPELRWFGSTSFSLTAPGGESVATAQADPSGAVVFTLTDYAATHPLDLHGACSFSTVYTVAGTGGDVTLSFQVGSQVIPVTVGTAASCGQTCVVDRTTASKASWWTGSAQTAVLSVIRAPASTSDSSSVTIVDTPEPGLALDCASLEPRIGAVLGSDGYVVVPGDASRYPAAVTCSPQQATVWWTGLPAGEFTEVWVDATVVDPSLAVYRNAGTVTIDGVDTPVSNQVVRTDAQGSGVGTAPTTTVPTTTVPTTTVPTTTVPTTTVPTTTVPTTTVPTTTVPTTTVPTTTVPTTTVPTTTVPTTTVPTTATGIPGQPTRGTGETSSAVSIPATPPAGTRSSTTPAAAAAPSSPVLAFTGANAGVAVAAAIGLLLLGAGLRLSMRRSQH
jgi:hypothetical protein